MDSKLSILVFLLWNQKNILSRLHAARYMRYPWLSVWGTKISLPAIKLFEFSRAQIFEAFQTGDLNVHRITHKKYLIALVSETLFKSENIVQFCTELRGWDFCSQFCWSTDFEAKKVIKMSDHRARCKRYWTPSITIASKIEYPANPPEVKPQDRFRRNIKNVFRDDGLPV